MVPPYTIKFAQTIIRTDAWERGWRANIVITFHCQVFSYSTLYCMSTSLERDVCSVQNKLLWCLVQAKITGKHHFCEVFQRVFYTNSMKEYPAWRANGETYLEFWSMKFVKSNGNFNMAGKRVQECHIMTCPVISIRRRNSIKKRCRKRGTSHWRSAQRDPLVINRRGEVSVTKASIPWYIRPLSLWRSATSFL